MAASKQGTAKGKQVKDLNPKASNEVIGGGQYEKDTKRYDKMMELMSSVIKK